jgi:hypothetical protein
LGEAISFHALRVTFIYLRVASVACQNKSLRKLIKCELVAVPPFPDFDHIDLGYVLISGI